MKLTTNLGLKKPDGTDVVNIDDFNYNADILDVKIKENILNIESNTNTLNSHFGYCYNADSVQYRGIFHTDSDNIGNLPKNKVGLLINNVWDVNYAFQIYNPHITTAELYIRIKVNNIWGDWLKLATTSTYSLLEQQISELEIQLLENEV